MKRTMIIVFFFLLCNNSILASNPRRPLPKWTNREKWLKLEKELPEKRVENLLGSPSYVQGGAPEMMWYYQDIPKCENKKEKTNSSKVSDRKEIATKILVPPTYGIIIFENKRTTQSRPSTNPRSRSLSVPVITKPYYVVKHWQEPDWTRLNESPPITIPKQKKVKTRLAKWEKLQSWKKLKINIPDKAVKRILGNPQEEIMPQKGRQMKKWYYGDVQDCGVLFFEGNLLHGWKEPFWPEVDKAIRERAAQQKEEGLNTQEKEKEKEVKSSYDQSRT